MSLHVLFHLMFLHSLHVGALQVLQLGEEHLSPKALEFILLILTFLHAIGHTSTEVRWNNMIPKV